MKNDLKEYLPMFIENMRECAVNIDNLVGRLKGKEFLEDDYEGLRRQFHTIKGDARILGFTSLASFSETIELMIKSHLSEKKTLSDHEWEAIATAKKEIEKNIDHIEETGGEIDMAGQIKQVRQRLGN